MEQLFEVKGSLQKGFVGQISYNVCLDKDYRKMDIFFGFDKDKQRYSQDEVTKEVIESFRNDCDGQYGIDEMTDEQVKEAVLGNCKTEIHLSAFLDGRFIGCIHKQLSERHMLFTPDELSEGCLFQDKITGALKVTILVFNVIKDDTNYSLSVSCG